MGQTESVDAKNPHNNQKTSNANTVPEKKPIANVPQTAAPVAAPAAGKANPMASTFQVPPAQPKPVILPKVAPQKPKETNAVNRNAPKTNGGGWFGWGAPPPVATTTPGAVPPVNQTTAEAPVKNAQTTPPAPLKTAMLPVNGPPKGNAAMPVKTNTTPAKTPAQPAQETSKRCAADPPLGNVKTSGTWFPWSGVVQTKSKKEEDSGLYQDLCSIQEIAPPPPPPAGKPK